MKKLEKDAKGITLVTLIITIVVILILASIATYSSIEIVKSSKFTKFTTEMKIMQIQVNTLYEKYKNGDNEILNLGKDLDEQADIVFTSDASGVTEKSGYKYFDQETIQSLEIKGVESEFFVNIEKRSIVSYEGLKYEGTIYYTLEQLPSGLYNVDYDENINTGTPTFETSVEEIDENKWKISIYNIVYNEGYIDKWQVEYQLEGQDYWNTSEELSFIVNEEGNYTIKIVNRNVKADTTIVVKYKTIEELEAGEYVYYTYKEGENPIKCIVLYDTKYNTTNNTNYGVQIISNDSVTGVELGNGTGSKQCNNSDYFNIARDAYNNALITLYNKAQDYLNTDYATSARCVGSVPDNPSWDTNEMFIADSSYSYMTNYNETFKVKDENYNIDWERMGVDLAELNIKNINKNYWLASRYISSTSEESDFFVRYISNDGYIISQDMCYLNSSGYITTLSSTYGFRPVFTLKSGIKLRRGDGSKDNPYILKK